MKPTVTELPFNRFLGLEQSEESDQLLRLPLGAQYLNHLGTVHASAQLALAEAASGEFLLRHVELGNRVLPVVRRMEAKFRRPATGALTASARVAPKALDQLNAEIIRKGRALMAVTVELHDETSAHVLTAVVEWFIQRIKE